MGHKVHASIATDLENYTIGDIDGQEPFYHSSGLHNMTVSFENPQSGAKGIKLATGGAGGYRATTTPNSLIDTLCFSFYINGDLGVSDNLLIKPRTATSQLASIYILETATTGTYYINAGGNTYNSGMLEKTWYDLCVNLDLILGTGWAKIDNNDFQTFDLSFPGATLEEWSFDYGNLDVEIYLDDFNPFYLDIDDNDDVIIVDYPFSGEVEIMGTIGFDFDPLTYCIHPDEATSTCKINIWYGEDYFDHRAVLKEFDPAEDSNIDLYDNESMILFLDEVGRNGTGKDYLEATNSSNNYKEESFFIYTWDPLVSTTTYERHGLGRVIWLSADEYYNMSNEEKTINKILSKVKNIFPWSLWFLMQGKINDAQERLTDNYRFELTFDHILENTIYASSTTGASSTIFSISFIEDYEDTEIYDRIQYVFRVLLWIITIGIILYLILKTFTSND